MKTLIQLRGSCGSGKTTVAQQIIKHGNYSVKYVEVYKRQYPYTVSADGRVIITGRYDSRTCGGVDGCITNRRILSEYLIVLMKIGAEILLFEGVMYGITYKFSSELSKICEIYGYKYKAYALIPDFSITLDRVYIRNNGKHINEKGLGDKYDSCFKTSKKLKASGIDIEFIDTGEYKFEDMYKIVKELS